MSQTIQCTHCNAVLKLKAPVAAGKRIVCPKCKETFRAVDDGPLTEIDTTTAVDMAPMAAAPNAVRATAPAPAPDGDPDLEKEAAPPRSRKRKEADDDEAPPKPAIKKRSSSLLVWIFLLGGGFVAVLGCIGCGVGGYFVYLYMGGPNIRGTWEVTNMPMKETVEFRADGTGTIEDQFQVLQMKYTVRKEDPPIVEWEITRQDQKKLPPFGFPMNLVGMRRQFRLNMHDEQNMTLSPINDIIGRPLSLRRMK